ncbi:hypothetical protein [Devosia sp. 2618]|uniref:hypothetical protein n=1 Tax=Devosia sp. 2618 TaxID=3156454 RepID=UPI0033984D20
MNRNGWTEIWGELNPTERLQSELGLVEGHYRMEPTDIRFNLTDPIYGEQKPFAEEIVTDLVSGAQWRACITEITNGVYAILYQPAVPAK